MRLVKGSWYWVTWVDAASGSGDVAKATASIRRMPLKFFGWAFIKGYDATVRYAKFGCLDEVDKTDFSDSDWWALPQKMILTMKEMER